MTGGFRGPNPGDWGALTDLLTDFNTQLAELQVPSGTNVNSLVAQVQQAIANINTTVDAAISANSYTKTQIDSKIASPGAIAPTDVTASGQMYQPNATPATTSYVVGYWDGAAGKWSKGASTERVKHAITALRALGLGDLFEAGLWSFIMNDDSSRMVRVGEIAERLNEVPHLRRFVVYEREHEYDDDGNIIAHRLRRDDNGDPIPESIDFISLLIARTFQLHDRLTAVEARLDRLEEGPSA